MVGEVKRYLAQQGIAVRSIQGWDYGTKEGFDFS
jgi:hypothetical protein